MQLPGARSWRSVSPLQRTALALTLCHHGADFSVGTSALPETEGLLEEQMGQEPSTAVALFVFKKSCRDPPCSGSLSFPGSSVST